MTARNSLEHPHERTTDRLPRPLAEILEWWQRWGQLLIGLWLIVVSIALLVVAVAFVKSQDRVAKQAGESCIRAKRLGPYIVRDYERRQALPPEILAEYRSLIPKSCRR